jgi:hypothetical protein
MTLDGRFDHTAMIADEELHQKAAALFHQADLLICGRKMHQLMEEFWPAAEKDPSMPRYMLDFAKAINEMDKIVYSRRLNGFGWKTRIFRDINAEEINRL